MSARLISLVLAVVLAAAPMQQTICEWSCADGIHGSAATAAGHHATDGSVPDHEIGGRAMAPQDHRHRANVVGQVDTADAACCSTAIALVPRCCDHADSHVAPLAAAKIAVAPPAITPTVFDVSDQIVLGAPIAAVTPIARPPVSLSLLTPLRL